MSVRSMALGVLVASLWGGAAGAHGTSKSYAEWTFKGRRAEVRVAFASHDVIAAEPALDSNEDGALSAQELAENSTWLAERLSKQGHPINGGSSGCVVKERELQGLSVPVEEIQLSVSFVCDAMLEHVTVRALYLPQLEPPHTSVASFSGPGLDATHVFSTTDPQVELHIQRPPLATQLASAAQGVMARALRARTAMLLLALLVVTLAGMRWRLALLMAFMATGVSGRVMPVFLPLCAAGLLAAAAGLLAMRAGPVLRGVWAVAAGLVFGWGLTWPLLHEELPVKVMGHALVFVLPVVVVAFGALLPPRWAQGVRRPMASGLVAAALALAWLALS